MKERNKRIVREVPPNYKNIIEAEWFRTFRLKERLQILFGYRVRLKLRMITEHKPGRYHPEMTLSTTPELEPKIPHEIPNRLEGQQ